MQSLTVQIPKPCHERWNDMLPNERGRFCESCQKTVVDYSGLSDREIVRLLNKSTGEVCGRFRNSQLERPLISSNPNTTWRQWISVLTMSVFGWQTASAQVNQTGNSIQPNAVKLPTTRPTFAVNTLSIQKTFDPNAKRLVSGRVMLMDSSKHLSPVTSAKVTIYQGGGWETETDSTGAYAIEIPVQTAEQANNPFVSDPIKITVFVSAPGRLHGKASVETGPSTTPVKLNDIILYQQRVMHDVIGGGIAIIRKPSLWQKLKRKIFPIKTT